MPTRNEDIYTYVWGEGGREGTEEQFTMTKPTTPVKNKINFSYQRNRKGSSKAVLFLAHCVSRKLSPLPELVVFQGLEKRREKIYNKREKRGCEF